VTARDRARRLLPTALAVAGVIAGAAGAALVAEPPVLEVAEAHAAPADAGAAPGDAGAAPATPRPAVAGPAAVPVPGVTAVAAPVRVTVPDVAVAAEVVPVGVDESGALELPDDPRVLGWWSSGAVPGAGEGSTVLAAHVDAAGVGAGPMSRVLRAPLGTPVEVTTADGATVRYTVVERRSYTKADGLPAELFRADGPPRLVLITCGGAFDAASGRYADNVVVVAAPA
jgi:hypothetical protein